ncbi:MAG: DUF192 domain-containing protein [Bacteriovorax sp.]|nr:DUF192 domain-containing protein [Bacteriovorax sp.]
MTENKSYILKDSEGEIICNRMLVADAILNRMKGLMFTTDLTSGDGLLITPCNSIHTFFMLYGLDVLFLDKNFKVIKVIYNLTPWKITRMYFKASQVVEMKAGTMKKNLHIGDKLEAICIS